MCGIVGYIGEKEACPFLLKGLATIEYRGYDSVGICTAAGLAESNKVNNNGVESNTLHLLKNIGRIEQFWNSSLPGKQGLAHSRWATHGSVCQKNAHPFVVDDTFALVHNGIIENYLELKEELRQKGAVFSSDTDSEVIVHLIAENWRNLSSLSPNSLSSFNKSSSFYKLSSNNSHNNHSHNNRLVKAVQETVKRLRGAYAFAVMHKECKEIVAARNGCPLIIGLGEGENFLASDVAAFIEHTKKAVYVNDLEIVRVAQDAVELFSACGEEKEYAVKEIQWNIEQAQKQGFPHFMLKEIFEQPQTFEETLKAALPNLSRPKRLLLIACGTASYAGLVGKYVLEKITGIPVAQETASEFRYQEPLFFPEDLVVVISQSGETADTLAAVRLAKEHHVKTLGIVNVVESTIAREVDEVIYTRAGPEIGVASTKAFTAQVLLLYKLAFHFAGEKAGSERNEALRKIKSLLEETLQLNETIKEVAQRYVHYQHFLYLGRNALYPLALEGALKLKEISYIHAEAYAAGELKHGPIALVSEDVPTLALCPESKTYDKTFSNIQEVKARLGKVIAIASRGDEKIKKISDDVIIIPRVDELFLPFAAAIPLQLFAYHLAAAKGCDIDKPRNLAKSVTVE